MLLLVEDSDDDAFLFTWTFEKAGIDYSVHHVSNGMEAIEFLGKASQTGSLPRMVLLDLKMPVLNGFDVLTWLQKQSFAPQVPVVMVSGSAQQEDKDKSRHLGARDYLIKPVTVPDLLRVLSFAEPNSTHAGKEASN
ncbi:MAG TPA: response regulator [Verrucomicrobiae bacterium]